DPIQRPTELSSRVDFEGELAVVIGRLCRQVPADRVAEVIFGYTCANDVTARDLQAKDGQWTRGKGFDTFCPLGPWIETDVDPGDLELSTRLNGEVKQHSRTSLLLHGVHALVMFVSQVMTLLPGDVLLTGTPAGIGPMDKGDQVTVTIEGIGTLSNPVTDRDYRVLCARAGTTGRVGGTRAVRLNFSGDRAPRARSHGVWGNWQPDGFWPR